MPSVQKGGQIHRLGRHSESPFKTAPPYRHKWDPPDRPEGKCALPTEEGSSAEKGVWAPKGTWSQDPSCTHLLAQQLLGSFPHSETFLTEAIKTTPIKTTPQHPVSLLWQIHTWEWVRWALSEAGTKFFSTIKTKLFLGMVIFFLRGKKKVDFS